MKRHVLDANALYRFLLGKPGAEVVNRLLKQAKDGEERLAISVVNWGEVYYTIAKVEGFKAATSVMDRVALLPLEIVPADRLLTASAAKLKAGFGLPYADCFAAAVAGATGTLVTADVKDFRRVPGLKLLALPGNKSSKAGS